MKQKIESEENLGMMSDEFKKALIEKDKTIYKLKQTIRILNITIDFYQDKIDKIIEEKGEPEPLDFNE